MKLKLLLFTGILVLLHPLQMHAQRIVGYLEGTSGINSVNQIEYDKVTDVVFCFIMPTTAGVLIVDQRANVDENFQMDVFQYVKSKCYPMTDNGPKLWIAVCGAGVNRDARVRTVLDNAAARNAFATNLAAFVALHELEGVDLDWEPFPPAAAPAAATITNYGTFINSLRAALPAGKKISIAIGGEPTGGCGGHASFIPNNATVIGNIDYFHIMTYDMAAVNHSTLAMSNTAMNNWNACRSIPRTKMLMGVPFYARTDHSSYGGVPTAYSALPVGAQNSDNNAGRYYNAGVVVGSGNSIPQKINDVRITHNGNGIFIWKLENDRMGDAANSLLRYADAKMFGNAVTNPCSTRPYMGKDTTMCVGQNLVLNPGVAATSAAGTRTFAWTRNGTPTGGNTNTLTITQAGTYKVTITQAFPSTSNTCVLSDEIIVTEQPAVTSPVASPEFVCATGDPSSDLSATSTGTVQWYTTATGGAALASSTVTPSVTTTYYAQAAPALTNKVYYGGRPALPDNSINCEFTKGSTLARPEWMNRITVLQPITIKSVVAYLSETAHTNIEVIVLDATQPASNAPVATTGTFSIATTHPNETYSLYPNILTVNITLQPGDYYVGVYNPNGYGAGWNCASNPGIGIEYTTTHAVTGVANVFSIAGNAYSLGWGGGSAYGATTAYGPLYDWRIESASLSQCSRQSVTVTYDCTLPVELLSFTGKNKDQKNYLSWVTGSETNNHYFDIERSADGISYEVIGSIEGSGNSREMLTYSFIDQDPLGGANYYRLAQYDFDGTVSYKVIAVDNKFNMVYEISPNPFDNSVVVRSNKTDHARSILICNIQGAVVSEERMEAGIESVTLGSNLGAGVYFVKIMDGESAYNYKIIKK